MTLENIHHNSLETVITLRNQIWQIIYDSFQFPKTRIDFYIHKCTFTSISCIGDLGVDKTHLDISAIVVETRVHFCKHIEQ